MYERGCRRKIVSLAIREENPSVVVIKFYFGWLPSYIGLLAALVWGKSRVSLGCSCPIAICRASRPQMFGSLADFPCAKGADRRRRRIGKGYAKPFVKMVRDWLLKPRGANPLGRPSIPQHPVLARIGAAHGKSAAQVALRWRIEQEGVAAIPRPTSERECRENLDIFDFALTAEDRVAIAALAGDYRVVDSAHAPAWDSPPDSRQRV